jgi:2'-hydroxyisoflavone reductase
MKLLIIGGTKFLGRHLVASAIAGNHTVTLFNRGKHSSANMPDVDVIYGDRNSDLAKLAGRSWDAVIDTCGYLPGSVKASADALSDAVERYVFISSISAYADFSVFGIDEIAPVATLTEEQLHRANQIDTTGEVSGATFAEMYGALKVLCEQAAEEVLTDRVLTIRAGQIVGSFDYTDRFTYWVERVARGGEVLAPGNPSRFVQFIDVRDLCEWIIQMVERRANGTFNATGIPNKLTMARLLDECKIVSKSNARFTWVSEDFLNQEKVAAWSEMPLWLSEETVPQLKGFLSVNCDKAVASGLKFRPLKDTIQDVLTWRETNCKNEKLNAGLDSDTEQDLLRKWHKAHQLNVAPNKSLDVRAKQRLS